jgi:hypothetical protein
MDLTVLIDGGLLRHPDITADITFTYLQNELGGNNTITESLLAAQHNDGVLWSQAPEGTPNVFTNQVSVPDQADWNFAWTLVNAFMPLPIDLVDFKAELRANRTALCEWSTLSETNNDYFTIERSSGNMEYTDIGMVDGAGNSLSELNYNFIDQQPLEGWNYYRLRQTDYSGESSLSEVRPVFVNAESSYSVSLFPNPVADGSSSLLVASDGDIQISISLYNQAGAQVKSPVNKYLEAGQQVVPISWRGLESGSYLMVVSSTFWTEYIRVVVL